MSEQTRDGALSGEETTTKGSEYQGILFVISSPSGGGKGTLIRRVRQSIPQLGYSVSWTTRAPRKGEVNGVNYHFVSLAEFERMRESGGFLEWAIVHGNLYATAQSAVEQETARGRDVVLEIDVQGATSIRGTMNDAVQIFILPPSYEVLRERLLRRQTESPAQLALRLRNSRGEVERYNEFDYVVLNDEVERAAAQIASIVYAERACRKRQEWLARRVLATFPEFPPED